MKRWLIALSVLVVIAAVGVGGHVAYTIAGREGATKLENWVGRSVVGIIEAHLTGEVEFAQLDYQAPLTVVIDGLSLTGRQKQPLLEVHRLELTLAQVPRLNQPVQIAKIILESPSIHIAQDGEGKVIGWGDLVEPDVLEGGLSSVPENYRLSEVLVMRRIEIDDGQVEYRSGLQSEAMVLRGVTTALDTAPQPDEPGWYALKGSMKRLPQLDIDFDGRFNLDTFALDLANLTTSMKLEQAQYETLPPQIQTFVRQYALRGNLQASVSGTFPTTDLASSAARLEATLGDAFASFGDKVLPVDEVHVRADLADQSIEINAQAQLLSGDATAKVTATLSGEVPITAVYDASKINLKQTIATASPDSSLPYDGILAAQGRVQTCAMTPLESISGGGSLQVDKGKLVNLPIFSDLVRALSIPLGRKYDGGRDAAHVEYYFMPDHIAVAKLELTSDVLAARGDGKVYYDQRLALAVNAGPMEKVQGALGAIGDLFGKITDKLVKYYISGTVEDPKVSVKPLGIGAGG